MHKQPNLSFPSHLRLTAFVAVQVLRGAILATKQSYLWHVNKKYYERLLRFARNDEVRGVLRVKKEVQL